MIPVRVLLVGEAGPGSRKVCVELESAGYEVATASTEAAGLLALARREPDVLVLDPRAGSDGPNSWRRAIDRYRGARPLGLLAFGSEMASKDRRVWLELADLGFVERDLEAWEVRNLVTRWSGLMETVPHLS